MDEAEQQRKIEIAGVLINDLIGLSGVDGKAALAEAARQYAEEHADDPPDSGLKFLDISEEGFAKAKQRPGWRHYHDVMKAEAAVAYAFIRRICNNHSPEEAERLIFGPRPGAGSGRLMDYIGKLMSFEGRDHA
jgi:hypothetical protein